jgi:hypothetical protein
MITRENKDKIAQLIQESTSHPKLKFSDTLPKKSGMSFFQEELLKLGIKEVEKDKGKFDSKKHIIIDLGWPVRSGKVLKVPTPLAIKILALGFFPWKIQ